MCDKMYLLTTTHYWQGADGDSREQLLMAGDRAPVTIIITSQCTQCTAVQRLECRHASIMGHITPTTIIMEYKAPFELSPRVQCSASESSEIFF